MNKISCAFLSLFLFTLGSCTVNNAKINNNLKKYFDSSNVEGCFSFYDNQMGTIIVYNMKLDTEQVTPGNSFKILNSLIGIQTGRISNENTVLNTDITQNKNLTFKEAFHNSSPLFFQTLARQIGKDTMKFWIDSLHYGNKIVSGSVDSLWLNPYLKISPDEQLGLVSKLYFEQLPLQKYAQQMVEDQMLQEDNTLYQLSYATGTGIDEKDNSFDWVLGWIVENRHVYFFVTYIRSPQKDLDMNSIAIHISKSILKGMGFFKGEK
ncbi:MAG TPA: penicillin-binding transpeptidase domain-containing protein [Hanamia sp.]